MNERIRELAKQSGGEFWQRIESNGVLNPEAYITFDPPESLEKFAELIVQECVKNLETNKRCDIYTGELTDCDWNDVIQHQIDSLKEHFGVER